MKKFLFDLVIGVTFIIIFGGILEYYAATHDNNYRYKYWYLNEHSKEIKTLLLGNSHFENSLNSHLLGDSVFNAAISGRWIYYDYKILERYITNMPNLKTVIFSLGYKMPFISYHNHEIDEIQKKYIYHYSIFMHIPYDKYPESIIYHSSFLAGMVFDQQEQHTCDSLGYDMIVGQVSDWKNDQNISISMVEDDEKLCSDTIEYTEYLTQLAEICYQNNVRFIVVTCPCHDVYIANTEYKGHQIRYEIISRVQSKYPLEYYDYLQDSEFRADSLYRNCSHLNHEGGSKFAVRLKKDLSM